MAAWLVTRPPGVAEALAEALAARGQSAILAPLMRVEWRDPPPPAMEEIQGLIFTSAHGVEGWRRLGGRTDLPVWAVGEATGQAARAAGFEQITAAEGDAESLARLIVGSVEPSRGALLHVHGHHVAGDLPGALAPHGIAYRETIVYRMNGVARLPDKARAALTGGGLAGVLHFSPRSAGLFARLVRAAGLDATLRPLTALCLSPAVAARLDETLWGEVRIAARPHLDAILALLPSEAQREDTSPSGQTGTSLDR